jgi:hypothetical protein
VIEDRLAEIERRVVSRGTRSLRRAEVVWLILQAQRVRLVNELRTTAEAVLAAPHQVAEMEARDAMRVVLDEMDALLGSPLDSG